MINFETRYALLRDILLQTKRCIDNELPACALIELDKAMRWIEAWDNLDELDNGKD